MAGGRDFDSWMREAFGADYDFLPVDLGPIVDGDLEPPTPTMLRRADGNHLIYEGRVHWVSSEPEAGKTWLALLATREVVNGGGRVIYFDYEMSPLDVVRRLLQLGTSGDKIRNNGLDYIRPPSKMSDDVLRFYGAGDEEAGSPPLFEGADLVVFDACTEAMVADGFDPLSNTDVAAWLQRAPRLAQRLGAAVLVLDHVPKDRESRGRYAIGAQHKLAQTDVGYALYNTEPFRPGGVGLSAIAVTKDRPGGVRAAALDGRRAGTLVLNAEDPELLEGFVADPKEDEGPTRLMGNILEFARESRVPLAKGDLETIGGAHRRSGTRGEAVTRLIASGALVPAPGEESKRYPKYVAAEDAA